MIEDQRSLQHHVHDDRRRFFVGWPAVISYLSITVGLARLLDIGYVTTLLEGAPLGFLIEV